MFKKLFNSLVGNNDESEQEKLAKENAAKAEALHEENVEEDDSDEDDGDDEQNYEVVSEVEFDEETLHGKHYTVAAFDAEVEKRSEKWIASEKESDPNFSQQDIDNVYFNYKREVYCQWNNITGSKDQMLRWEMVQRNLAMGLSATGQAAADDNDPLLAPIHGLTLRDYTAMNNKLGQGVDAKEVLKAMGIEQAILDELNVIWPKRMQEDPGFKIATLMGQYFKDDHPKLMHLKAATSAAGQANLEKLKTDAYFYEELAGARQAAYEYGLDGAQWIVDNFGINLGDFQEVAMKWMTERTGKNWDTAKIQEMQNYQEQKQKEYAAKFAAEQGGNVADDVEF